MTPRRRLLAAPLLALAAAPRGAGAFRLEPAAPADARAWRGGACADSALHEALLAAWRGLAGGAPPPGALAGLARCPSCGCPVPGAAGHGEAAPEG